MAMALDMVRPRLMVLLETELWPGLLHALKSRRIPILIINGRMSEKSRKRYMGTRQLWRPLAPDRILAISRQDTRRYQELFPDTPVETMANIKFDTLSSTSGQNENLTQPNPLIPQDIPLTILASFRKEEEKDVEKILTRILSYFPKQIVALFPRHMHRMAAWQEKLDKLKLPWHLKSQAQISSGPLTPGTIILWDTFGELKQTYSQATTAFVGGSLAPLGGQNFLEPMLCGTFTVTGPHLDHFAWVGKEVFIQGLATRAKDWKDVADHLVRGLTHPLDRTKSLKNGKKFLQKKQGGLNTACQAITQTLRDI